MRKKTLKKGIRPVQYGVWVEPDTFWALYDTLEDAISDNGDEVEVYEMKPRLLGKYKRSVKVERIK